MSKSTHRKEIENIFDKNMDRLAERTDVVLSKVTKLDESVEEYTQKELEYLDRYKEITGDAMDDEEIYDIIIKHNFDNSKIRKEIDELMKLVLKKGEEYGWTKIENGKKAKAEKKELEVKVEQRGNKYNNYNKTKPYHTGQKDYTSHTGPGYYTNKDYTNKDYTNKDYTSYNKDYSTGHREYTPHAYYKKDYRKTEDAREVQTEEVVQDYKSYDSYSQNNYYNNNYNNNNYRNNYNSNYRGSRGRGYYNIRGGSSTRGRSQGYKNYYGTHEDQLFDQELNAERKIENYGTENEVVVSDSSKVVAKQEPEKELTQSHSVNIAHEKEKEHHKEVKENKIEKEHQPMYTHTQQHSKVTKEVSHPHENTHKQIHHEDDSNNIFNSKDIPSNIRSNIDNLFNENDSANDTKNFSSHNQHNNILYKDDGHKQRKYNQEFSVQSSSMSIGIPSNQNQKQIITNSNKVNTVPSNVNVNTPYQNTSFTQQGQSFKPTTTAPQVNNNVKNVKKNDNSTGTTTEYAQQQQQGYMPPWGMGPMGYFMQGGGMNYDPNQMGGNNPMYPPMMPMYFYPGYGYPQPEIDENIIKGQKKTNFNMQPQTAPMDMNNQQNNPNTSNPGFTPFYYYNPQNPYGAQMQMGMPSMGMPGMNMGVNPNMDPQNFGNYDMKNMKNTGNEEQNANYYYNFYKQS